MAKKSSGTGLKNLKEQLKNDSIGSVYLLFGEETFLKMYYYNELKKCVLKDSIPEFNLDIFEGSKIDWNSVSGSIESLPMMNDKRLVAIKDTGIFKAPNEEAKSFWQKRLGDIPEYVCLVFVEDEVDKRGLIYKAVASVGESVECEYLEGVELENWVSRGCREAGKQIGQGEITYLIKSCDGGMNNIKRELEKLFAYCADSISIQDIDRIVTKMPQSRVFDMINAIMAKDAKTAFDKLYELKTLKESVFMVLALLCTNFERILHTKILLSEGVPHNMIASEIKISPYFIRDYINAAQRFSKEYLRRAICDCAQIDYDIKQGKYQEWLALEQFVSKNMA